MRVLAKYKNGNYEVTLFEDGTKIKTTQEETFVADHPDSIDLKITDYCENDCPMCHENSSRSGRHGNLSHKIVDTFPSGMEVAIGGGNPLSHPDLLPFLARLKERGIIANVTVNLLDLLKNESTVEALIDTEAVHGVGVSCAKYDERAVAFALKHKNTVLHLINGVFPVEDYQKMMGKGLKILILGYKIFGRGVDFFSPSVVERMRRTKECLGEILRGFKVVSFDNLAIEQLDVKGAVGEAIFEQTYMGDDGEASMYVDLVKEEYALSSSTAERAPLRDSLQACFENLPKKG